MNEQNMKTDQNGEQQATPKSDEESQKKRHFADIDLDIDLDFGPEMGEKGVRIAREVLNRVERQMNSLAQHLDERLDQLDLDEMMSVRVHDKVENAMRRAETQVASALEREEQKIRNAERRAGRKNRSDRRHKRYKREWREETPSGEPEAQSDPASDEEKTLILRMIQEVKITVEQAEQLLKAL